MYVWPTKNEGIFVRPIVNFTRSRIYEWAKHSDAILEQLMGQTTTYLHNDATFCDELTIFTMDFVNVMGISLFT